MTFEYNNTVFNLLDTPGHEDFSEDTYRTLTAVDAAVMVIDAAKGIEARTRKLFEICRLRDIPIITFVNKMDRESREPLDLLDEIEKGLALSVAPMVWPIGMGKDFAGTYDLNSPRVRQLEQDPEGLAVSGPDDPMIDTLAKPDVVAKWRDEIGLVQDLCTSFDRQAFLEGISRRSISARPSRISASAIYSKPSSPMRRRRVTRRPRSARFTQRNRR